MPGSTADLPDASPFFKFRHALRPLWNGIPARLANVPVQGLSTDAKLSSQNRFPFARDHPVTQFRRTYRGQRWGTTFVDSLTLVQGVRSAHSKVVEQLTAGESMTHFLPIGPALDPCSIEVPVSC